MYMCTVTFIFWTYGVMDCVCIAMQVDSTDDCAIGSLSHQQRKELKSTVSESYNGTHSNLNELHYMLPFR